MSRINRDDVDKLYDYDIYIPQNTIYMGSVHVDVDGNESGTDPSMAERVIKGLHILEAKGISEKGITIIMNNPGGSWYDGMAIYDAIKACQNEVTIKVCGLAMSMGGIILQAADKRVMMPNSRFMMHYGDFTLGQVHSKTATRWATENEKINTEMENILLQSIQKVHPKFTLKQLQNLLNYDTIYNAQETVSMGLADEVS